MHCSKMFLITGCLIVGILCGCEKSGGNNDSSSGSSSDGGTQNTSGSSNPSSDGSGGTTGSDTSGSGTGRMLALTGSSITYYGDVNLAGKSYFTLGQYNSISSGMTYSQVCSALGMASNYNYGSGTLGWVKDFPSYIAVTFSGAYATSKKGTVLE